MTTADVVTLALLFVTWVVVDAVSSSMKYLRVKKNCFKYRITYILYPHNYPEIR